LEKSVCDAVKYRTKIGMETASEILKSYIRRLLFVYLSSGLFFTLKAQTVSGIVLDRETEAPLPYASVYLASLRNGIYSSVAGLFKLNYDNPNDTIIISVIGYKPYKDKIANLKLADNVIYLEPNTIALNEVVVTPSKKKKKTMMLGMLNKALNKLNSLPAYGPVKMKNDGSSSFCVEHYLFIEGINIPVRIKKIIVGCSKKEEQLEAVFRIKFYTKNNETNEPDQLVNKKDIVKSFSRTKSKTITFDVENENLVLPHEGLFVSVEHIGYNLHEQHIDTVLLNKYHILTEEKCSDELVLIYVKSKKNAISGVILGIYDLPFPKRLMNLCQNEKNKFNILIRLEVEELETL
jgi:hypothetical protein